MSVSVLSEGILEAIQSVVGSPSFDEPVALHEPDFAGTKALTYLKDCLDSGWVSTAGRWVTRFEEDLETITGASHAVAVTNGTVALRLALYVSGVRPGDEVLLPPLSFVATANAVSHLGAIPHFVDIDPITLGMCPVALSERLEELAVQRDGQLFNTQTGRRLAAVLPVHVFGNPADVIALRRVADEWDLPLVEDAAEALGSWRSNKHCGLFGSVGILSFNGNKLITTGGGGALLTNDSELAKRARHLSTTAKLPHPWEFEHDHVGWNDRMPNINAALGVAQLEDLHRRLEQKARLAELYRTALSSTDGVEVVEEAANCRSNHWLVTLRLSSSDLDEVDVQRLKLLNSAHSAGFLLRPVWKLLPYLPMYSSAPRAHLPTAEDQVKRLINLPSSPQLLR